MNPVLRSQAVLVSTHTVRVLLSVAVAVVLGRYLEPADFGFVALVASLYIVAVEILDMGTTAAATRMISARGAGERETLAALLALRRLLSAAVLALVLALACSGFVQRDDHKIALAVAACGVFLLHFHAYQLVFQLRQAYGPVSTLTLACQVGFLLASVVALGMRAGGAVIALLVVAREAVHALGARWMGARVLGGHLRAPWLHPGAGALLRASWRIGVAGIAYKLAAYSGVFILWRGSSPEALATFSAAHRVLVPLADMAWLFVTPLIAALSSTAADAPAQFRAQLLGHARFLVPVACLVAAMGYFAAPLVLRLLYGELYAAGPLSAVPVFRWIAVAYLFALVSPVLVVGEMALGNSQALMLTASAALAVNLAANAWAIPRFGAEGAAMALFVSEAFFFAVLTARGVRHAQAR